jgi:hypothetical protein
MNSTVIKKIGEGDINLLKQLNISKITYEISSRLLDILEENKLKTQQCLDNNLVSSDIKDYIIYYRNKLNNIDECILYLKKIT